MIVLPKTAQFDKSMNLFCLVLLTLDFFFDTRGFHCFLYNILHRYNILLNQLAKCFFRILYKFFIFSFILLDFLNTLFTEKILSWLIYHSIKVLEIRTSIVFNVLFPKNTILSCYSFFFLIIDLYFWIPAVIAQTFIPTAEIVIPTITQTNEEQ